MLPINYYDRDTGGQIQTFIPAEPAPSMLWGWITGYVLACVVVAAIIVLGAM